MKFLLYRKSDWLNGNPHLSLHETDEQAKQAALALIRQSLPRVVSTANPALTIINSTLESELFRLRNDYVIAQYSGNNLEHALRYSSPEWVAQSPKGQ